MMDVPGSTTIHSHRTVVRLRQHPLDDGSDFYVANRGDNTIVRMGLVSQVTPVHTAVRNCPEMKESPSRSAIRY